MKKFLSITIKLLVAVALAAGLGAGALQYAHRPAPAAPVVAAKPPTPVVVQTLTEQNVRLWTDFSGRLHAVDYAEIRPEVSGRIMAVRFADGQSVKAGDILFVIDPRPYADAVARAEADLASAQSKAQLAKSDLDRYAALIASHAVAQSELDKFNDAQRVAGASQAQAEAALRQANLDLEHAYVTAPISGRVSRAEITVGNLVQSGAGAPLLTSIVSQDGIYADFEVDEQTYLQSVRNVARNNAQESHIPVQLVISGDKEQPTTGFIQSFDNRLDTTSGTIRARARFENADGVLVPGMFVTVRMASAEERSALLVPERALSFDQSKKYVFVVDAASKVSYREVALGRQVGGNRVVESGLQAGDRVIVDGVQRVHPEDTVDRAGIADRRRPRFRHRHAGGEKTAALHEPLAVLHRPPDFRRGHLVHHLPGGADLGLSAADLGISRGGAADHCRHRAVSRRESQGHFGDGGDAAGGADQRDGKHALHVFPGVERRHPDADRHFQARHRREPGAATRAEPGEPGRAAAARRHHGRSASPR